MAWIMGLIKHFNGMMDGNWYSGWVDAATGKPIRDVDVKVSCVACVCCACTVHMRMSVRMTCWLVSREEVVCDPLVPCSGGICVAPAFLCVVPCRAVRSRSYLENCGGSLYDRISYAYTRTPPSHA